MSNPLELILIFFNYLYFVGGFLLSLWWIFIPWLLFVLVRDLWLKHKRNQFIQEMDWLLLEIKPPQEIKKTPRAMEQFFAALHGTQSNPNWRDRNIRGNTQRWFSLETVSLEGEIHFFIRTVSMFRDLIEANIYAQYPEAEITQVADYVHAVSSEVPNEDYDIWGTELMLVKDDAYPIRTYPEFERDIALEEQRIDPVASLLETMSKMGSGEQIWIQTLVRPVNDKWKKEGEKLRDKLVGRVVTPQRGEVVKEAVAWKEAGKEVAHQLLTGEGLETGGEAGRESETPFLWKSTKAEQDVINAIEQNISKLGFETIIRFIYLARSDVFKRANIAAVVGAYKQFNTQHLNGFKPNGKVGPDIDYRYQAKKTREAYRRKRVLADYQKRNFTQQSKAISYLKPLFFERLPIINWFFSRSKPFVFNIEELATIYHFPISTVKAPFVPKVEARRAEPPAELPAG